MGQCDSRSSPSRYGKSNIIDFTINSTMLNFSFNSLIWIHVALIFLFSLLERATGDNSIHSLFSISHVVLTCSSAFGYCQFAIFFQIDPFSIKFIFLTFFLAFFFLFVPHMFWFPYGLTIYGGLPVFVFKAGGGCEGRRYRYNMLHASTTIENQLRIPSIFFSFSLRFQKMK